MASIFIVSTPIGNLKDISLRAIETLKQADLIICEDTRVSSKLFNHYGIKSRLESLNEYNEDQKSYELLNLIENFPSVCLVSDAGTPLLSDPGYKFIKRAIEKGHTVSPVPGASSILASLVVSAMPTDKFTYLGFLPKSSVKQTKILEAFKGQNHTIIILESPHRIEKTLETIKGIFGDIRMSVSRELTKKFEQIQNDSVKNILEGFRSKPPRGEFTITFNPDIK